MNSYLIVQSVILINKNALINCQQKYFGCVPNGLKRFYHELITNIKDVFVTVDNKENNVKTKYNSTYNLHSDELQTKYKETTIHLVNLHGFKVESHEVITEDGYILVLHRIPQSGNNLKRHKKVALLHHGLLGSSADWFMVGHDHALPIKLFDLDYDVWLANSRGNIYSRAHTILEYNSFEFWDFSLHEIGKYDLPAIIDYIKIKTVNYADIHFIGHSVGATAYLVLMSTTPEYNQALEKAVLLAPIALMKNAKGPIRYLAELNTSYIEKLCGKKQFKLDFSGDVLRNYCKNSLEICSDALFFLTNSKPTADDTEILHLPMYFAHSTSTKTIIHISQLVRNLRFQMFDYGHNNNLKRYMSTSPTVYSLEKVTVPTSVISSNDDWLSSLEDNFDLISRLSKPWIHHVIRNKKFSHIDFVWKKDASDIVYSKIVSILKEKI